MIWTCARDGYCDYLSRQWIDYTGRSESQQLGRGWLEQVHPDDRVKVDMEWSRVVGTGDTFDITFRIRRFDEEATPYLSWAIPQFINERGGDYDHLARLWEWHVIGEAEGGEGAP